jgi:hypothetical protein
LLGLNVFEFLLPAVFFFSCFLFGFLAMASIQLSCCLRPLSPVPYHVNHPTRKNAL